MYAGGAGAIMPNKITSKHNFRYVPRMNGLDIVKKLRAQLDTNGYKDVEMKLIGDVPWSRGGSRDTDITHAGENATRLVAAIGLSGGTFGGFVPPPPPPVAPQGPKTSAAATNALFTDPVPALTGGYWPSYLWTDGEVGEKVGTVMLPMGQGAFAFAGGGRIHAANEYFTVEATGKTGGMATAEKTVAAILYEYAKLTTVPPKPKTSASK
jgi:acetylornithine deacetylase/succinyl-diaminopimelate desuccinylase-like protein